MEKGEGFAISGVDPDKRVPSAVWQIPQRWTPHHVLIDDSRLFHGDSRCGCSSASARDVLESFVLVIARHGVRAV
jgi:hypothetical protein